MYDELLMNNQVVNIGDVRQITKEFILNANDDKNLPEKTDKVIPYFGQILVSDKHVISLQSDRGTSYDIYIKVQNELAEAYNELRNDFAQEHLNKDYSQLSDEYKNVIKKIYPIHISEAEPRDVIADKLNMW